MRNRILNKDSRYRNKGKKHKQKTRGRMKEREKYELECWIKKSNIENENKNDRKIYKKVKNGKKEKLKRMIEKYEN